MHVLADRATFLIRGADSRGALSLVEVVLAPGGRILPHSHPDTDEVFYALEGRCLLHLADVATVLLPGACAFAPRQTVHALRNDSDVPARLLLVSVPAAGAERVFVELAASFAKGNGDAVLNEVIGRIADHRGVGLSDSNP
jgi:quercetin dioxygenase-like cupin family protein